MTLSFSAFIGRSRYNYDRHSSAATWCLFQWQSQLLTVHTSGFLSVVICLVFIGSLSSASASIFLPLFSQPILLLFVCLCHVSSLLSPSALLILPAFSYSFLCCSLSSLSSDSFSALLEVFGVSMFTKSSKTTLNSEQKGFQLCCHCINVHIYRDIHIHISEKFCCYTHTCGLAHARPNYCGVICFLGNFIAKCKEMSWPLGNSVAHSVIETSNYSVTYS